MLLAILILSFVIFFYLISKKTAHPGCDLNCDECPFPLCDEKDKEWKRQQLNK